MEKSPAGLDQAEVVIASGGREHRFIVEIARTAEEQRRGLMERQSLAADRGMLFPYTPPQPVSFWMRNTWIPLDILYVAPGGRIARIEADTVPFAEDQLHSGDAVEAVLELNGGQAAALGIKPGDSVRWRH
jgi:uncharacterized membrane protein (UPF0127 family)